MRPKMTEKQFAERAKKAHGNRYGYQETVYVDANTPVRIHCVKHGVFLQQPRYHVHGSGCVKCGREAMAGRKNHKLTKEQFVEKAKQVHGDLYDYGKTKYDGLIAEVEVVCKVVPSVQESDKWLHFTVVYRLNLFVRFAESQPNQGTACWMCHYTPNVLQQTQTNIALYLNQLLLIIARLRSHNLKVVVLFK